MARPTIEQDSKTFIAALRKIGERVGNGFFREHLGWTDTRYTRVREALIESGKVERGRGRGGSVGLPLR